MPSIIHKFMSIEVWDKGNPTVIQTNGQSQTLTRLGMASCSENKTTGMNWSFIYVSGKSSRARLSEVLKIWVSAKTDHSRYVVAFFTVLWEPRLSSSQGGLRCDACYHWTVVNKKYCQLLSPRRLSYRLSVSRKKLRLYKTMSKDRTCTDCWRLVRHSGIRLRASTSLDLVWDMADSDCRYRLGVLFYVSVTVKVKTLLESVAYSRFTQKCAILKGIGYNNAASLS